MAKKGNPSVETYRLGRLTGATHRLAETLRALGEQMGGGKDGKQVVLGSLRTLPEARVALQEFRTSNRAGRRREAKRRIKPGEKKS